MDIAVIGAGIAGLSCAYRLSQAGLNVSLFEANSHFGGHSHTVDVSMDGITHGVDTGFLVFNERTYPNLVALFAELGVETAASDMSFSVKTRMPGMFGARTLEWAGSNLDTVFVQRRNLLNPAFLRMLRDILRFNKQATALADRGNELARRMSLGDFLDRYGYGKQFRDWYLLPMAGCIWSCPTEQMLAFPLATFTRFCHNHGLLQVSDRPQWRTVVGGSRNYVRKLLAGIGDTQSRRAVKSVTRCMAGGATKVFVETADGFRHFDHVVLACHSDQSLGLLRDAGADEQAILSAIGYQKNRAVLHTDARCLPENRKAWSAWNYESMGRSAPEVCVHYLINRLQPLPFRTPVIVSLNPIREPHFSTVIGEFDFAHPVFDSRANAAQLKLPSIQGSRNTWYAGAWTGYGFHEDGLKSGLEVARALSNIASARGEKRVA